MKPRPGYKRIVERSNERGAALITTILLSTLLLTAGGILILITAMTGTNAVESTAEMQAYYAAEAGVARTLKVMRGNEPSNDGTLASFRNIVSDPTKWTSISGNMMGVDGASSFVVSSIIDPDDVDGSKRALDANYKPSRLKVQVVGYGPKSSTKQMEFIVNRYTTNFSVNSTITLPNGSGNAFNFNIGDSDVTAYSGLDASGNPAPPISAFGIAGSDYSAGQNVINGCQPDGTACVGNHPNVIPTSPMMLDASNTPSFLSSVPAARSFLYGSEDGMMNKAIAQGRYFKTTDEAIASPGGLGANNDHGLLTFVDGDFILGPGDPTGQGLLIVTGDLTLNGTFAWNGVIMVLGKGRVFRSGGGHGEVMGAMFIATFARTGADTDQFQPPTFDTSGGGTATIQYNSDEIDRAKGVGGHKVVGMREY